ncbi:hypothetical protein RHMOL_Rhmol02G0098800 [Rhododendron molle]|uniref:Uncharacterized protein n=1 Tax=Rhododendron molle TaxID=49168 RepID=A0ACC0PQ11_RHOML|nr:hypothetical protein RHMOL_Rhmol02G0098800 [Rhododendron molle]
MVDDQNPGNWKFLFKRSLRGNVAGKTSSSCSAIKGCAITRFPGRLSSVEVEQKSHILSKKRNFRWYS